MTKERPMPDFLDALEMHVREVAVETEPARHRTPLGGLGWSQRVAVASATCAAVLAAILIVSASNDHGVPTAYGKPLILNTAPVEATEVLERLQRRPSVRFVLGEDGRLTSARPVKAFGGTAFVLTGDKGWCLTAPDPAIGDSSTADPTVTGAITCTAIADVYRYGIALGVGNNAIAAVPDGAKSPTITSPNGDTQTLEPSSQGVVIADNVPHYSRLTLYGSDGSSRTLTLP